MELQSQHGPGGSLVVIQQPSLESRQRSDYERELQHAAILSLDQIKAIRSNNEYTEGPSVVRRPPAPRMVPRPQDKRSTRYNSQTHAVVSPAAAQLIQTLTTISSPPCLGSSCSLGITQRHWALTSSAVGREPAAGAEAWGTREG